MAFGTLRRDSFFSPGELLNEARALDEAVRLFARLQFDHVELVDPDWLARWNAFNANWRDFWAQCNAWDGWIFRAKNSTRDELLNLEAEYESLRSGLAQKLAAAGEADAAGALSEIVPEAQRTEDNVDQAVDDAGNLLKNVGWELVAGAAIVVVGAVGLIYVARRGGVPLPIGGA